MGRHGENLVVNLPVGCAFVLWESFKNHGDADPPRRTLRDTENDGMEGQAKVKLSH